MFGIQRLRSLARLTDNFKCFTEYRPPAQYYCSDNKRELSNVRGESRRTVNYLCDRSAYARTVAKVRDFLLYGA